MQWNKKYTVILIASALLIIAIVGIKTCKGYNKGAAPVAIMDTLPVDVPMSHFNIPITYSLFEFEKFINGKIKGEFLETTLSPTNNEKEQVKVEMKKVTSINISSKGNIMVVKFPLEVTATLLHSRANFLTRGIKPVVTQLTLELHTPVRLDSNWKLVTHFSLAQITWVKPPKLKIAGINFDLTNKLNEALQANKKNLCDLLDREINKAVSLKAPVEKIWLDLQKPMIINKKPPQAYLRFMCYNIGGNLKLDANNIICKTSIDAKVAMVTMTKITVPKNPLPSYKKILSNNEYSNVYVYAFAEFDEVNAQLNEKLAGRAFSAKGLSASIKKVHAFASDSGLTVSIDTKGDIESNLVASVVPSFDSLQKNFLLNNLQFNVESSNALLNMGDALLHEKILEAVKDDLMLSMDSLIRKVPALIEKSISKGKTGRTIEVNMDAFDILSCDIKMDAKRLYFLVHATFMSDIEIKRLKSGKSIRIQPKQQAK